jgi:hypothetical protein
MSIKSFNEHQENLNISDVISNFEGMRLVKNIQWWLQTSIVKEKYLIPLTTLFHITVACMKRIHEQHLI